MGKDFPRRIKEHDQGVDKLPSLTETPWEPPNIKPPGEEPPPAGGGRRIWWIIGKIFEAFGDSE